MAKPVYSVNLFNEIIAVGGVATYDVPEGVTVVIRDCTGVITPGPGSDAAVLLTVNSISAWTFGTPAAIPRRSHQEGRWVAPGPSTLELTIQSTDTTAVAECTINGYYLT